MTGETRETRETPVPPVLSVPPVSPGGAWRTLFLASLGALLFALAWRGTHLNGDGLLYIAHGRFMLEHGALPEVDPFSQSSMHRPLVLHMVLTMLGFAVVGDMLGLASLVPLTALAVAIALFAMVFPARARALSLLAALGLVLLLVAVDKELFEVRGQAFAYLPFVGFLALLERAMTLHGGRGGTPYGGAIGLAFPLVALWANVHPSFVVAIALPLLCLGALAVERRRDRTRARTLALAAFAAAALLGSLVTPYGPKLIADVVALIGDATTSKISHMRSPPVTTAWLAWLACSLAVIGAYAMRGPRPLRRVRVLVAAALVIATLLSRRYAVFATAFEIMLLASLVARCVGTPRGSAAKLAARIDAALARRTAHAALAACALAASIALVVRGPDDLHDDLPLEHIAVLDNARLPDRVLTEFAWGGALMYAWGESRGVHIDGRNNLYGNGVFDDYMRWVFDPQAALPLLDVYEINTILWPTPWSLTGVLMSEPGWRLVYRDEKAALFTRAPAQ